MINIKIFILCFLYFHVESKPNKKIIATWEELVSCPNFNNVETDLSKVSIYMLNETTFGLNGTIEIKTNIDVGPWTVKSILEKETLGGGYMSVLSYDIEDLCDKIKKPDDAWGKYLRALQPVPSCPQLKNVYDVSKIEPETADLELKKDMIGTYRLTIEMFRMVNGVPKKWCCYQLGINVDTSS